jgi:hypothetical protein
MEGEALMEGQCEDLREGEEEGEEEGEAVAGSQLGVSGALAVGGGTEGEGVMDALALAQAEGLERDVLVPITEGLFESVEEWDSEDEDEALKLALDSVGRGEASSEALLEEEMLRMALEEMAAEGEKVPEALEEGEEGRVCVPNVLGVMEGEVLELPQGEGEVVKEDDWESEAVLQPVPVAFMDSVPPPPARWPPLGLVVAVWKAEVEGQGEALPPEVLGERGALGVRLGDREDVWQRVMDRESVGERELERVLVVQLQALMEGEAEVHTDPVPLREALRVKLGVGEPVAELEGESETLAVPLRHLLALAHFVVEGEAVGEMLGLALRERTEKVALAEAEGEVEGERVRVGDTVKEALLEGVLLMLPLGEIDFVAAKEEAMAEVEIWGVGVIVLEGLPVRDPLWEPETENEGEEVGKENVALADVEGEREGERVTEGEPLKDPLDVEVRLMLPLGEVVFVAAKEEAIADADIWGVAEMDCEGLPVKDTLPEEERDCVGLGVEEVVRVEEAQELPEGEAAKDALVEDEALREIVLLSEKLGEALRHTVAVRHNEGEEEPLAVRVAG